MIDASFAMRENATVMEDRAWRHFFGRPVEVHERRLIDTVFSVRRIYGEARKTEVQAAIMIDMGVSLPVARNHLKEAVQKGLLVCSPNGGDDRSDLITIPFDVAQWVAAIGSYIPKIWKVAAIQALNLDDPIAGKNMLDIDIYFNCMSDGWEQHFKDNISRQIAKIKASK